MTGTTYSQNHNTFASIRSGAFCTSELIPGIHIDDVIKDFAFDKQCRRNCIARDNMKKENK